MAKLRLLPRGTVLCVWMDWQEIVRYEPLPDRTIRSGLYFNKNHNKSLKEIDLTCVVFHYDATFIVNCCLERTWIKNFNAPLVYFHTVYLRKTPIMGIQIRFNSRIRKLLATILHS